MLLLSLILRKIEKKMTFEQDDFTKMIHLQIA